MRICMGNHVLMVRAATCWTSPSLCSTVSVSFNTLNNVSCFWIYFWKRIIDIWSVLVSNDVLIARVDDRVVHPLVLGTTHVQTLVILCRLWYYQITLAFLQTSVWAFVVRISVHSRVYLGVWLSQSSWHVVNSLVVGLGCTFRSGWLLKFRFIESVARIICSSVVGMSPNWRRNCVDSVYHINLQSQRLVGIFELLLVDLLSFLFVQSNGFNDFLSNYRLLGANSLSFWILSLNFRYHSFVVQITVRLTNRTRPRYLLSRMSRLFIHTGIFYLNVQLRLTLFGVHVGWCHNCWSLHKVAFLALDLRRRLFFIFDDNSLVVLFIVANSCSGHSLLAFSNSIWLAAFEQFLNVVLVLLTENSCAFLSFKQQVICSCYVIEFISFDLLLSLRWFNGVVFLKHPCNLWINWDRLFTKEDWWSVRRHVLDLVEPRMVSDILDRKAMLWVGVEDFSNQVLRWFR